jgi:hypothetical protein
MDLRKSRLGDDAAIYAPRDERTEKQKWQDMTRSERFTHFKEYYLGKTLLIIAALALVIYFLYSVFSPKPATVLSVAVTDYTYLSETFSQISEAFTEYLELDPETATVNLDCTYLTSDYSSVEKLSIYVYTGELDIFIAPEDTFREYAQRGTISGLSSLLPSDTFLSLSDRFLMTEIVETDVDDSIISIGETDAYGIYLDSLSIFEPYSYEGSRPVIGIFTTGKNNENAVDFINYLFEHYSASGE